MGEADQIQSVNGGGEKIIWFQSLPMQKLVSENLNTFELMKQMIEAGCCWCSLRDQLSSAKKCGHLGGKVFGSYSKASINWCSKISSDVCGVPTVLVQEQMQ